LSDPEAMPRLPVVYGLAGPVLRPEEAAFFREARPFGFILFKRNCDDPDQVRALVVSLRGVDGCHDLPVLIDQEGGRVQRLQPPDWPAYPPAARFGDMARSDLDGAIEACRLNARLIADDLAELGIDVDCLPCLDRCTADTHKAIGDRAFSDDPEVIAALGRAQAEGLLAGGVLPVMKHLPGHGRATMDSHLELPKVDVARSALEETDFKPFRHLSDLPLAMTAHIVFSAIDADRPATQSPLVIDDVIRRHIGFQGLLFSDDLNMQALSGSIEERAQASLAAGCDVVLHCNGDMGEMQAIAARVGPMTGAAADRWAAAVSVRSKENDSFDREAAIARLSALIHV